MLRTEFETVQIRMPILSIQCPKAQPNTSYAILASAEASEAEPLVGAELRTKIKHALWRDGRDISDRKLIDSLREEAGLPRLRVTPELEQLVRWWQSQWEKLERRMIPTLVAPNGDVRPGLGDPEEAVDFVRFHVDRLTSLPARE
jgi:predicted DsbA family dithiol-disulfide isomerase